MTNFYEFISDDFQYKIKGQAVKASNGRFENTLQNYFNIFFEGFKKIQSSYISKPFKNYTSINVSKLYDWLDTNYDILQSDIDEYRDLFKDIIYTYELFIRGKHYQATLHIFDLLEKYKLSDAIDTKFLGLYYRGRTFSLGDNTNKNSYYSHIPFDKRFLIGNQRFSCSGQPILYLGSSIIDVLYELGGDINNYNSIAFASFRYNPFFKESINPLTNKPYGELKIFDITNNLYELIREKSGYILRDDRIIENIDTDHRFGLILSVDQLKKEFKRFILTQICTFKKNHNYTFIEEYVLAQILTEAIKINKYNGILFPSTQFCNKKIINNDNYFPLLIQENLALFTNYSDSKNYDDELLKYFSIRPLDKKLSFKMSVPEYKERICNLKGYNIGNSHSIFRHLSDICVFLGELLYNEEHVIIEGKPYLDWDFAKLELFSQLDYMEFLKKELDSYIANFRKIS